MVETFPPWLDTANREFMFVDRGLELRPTPIDEFSLNSPEENYLFHQNPLNPGALRNSFTPDKSRSRNEKPGAKLPVIYMWFSNSFGLTKNATLL